MGVMAYIFMAHTVMAHVDMAYIAMVPCSYGRYRTQGLVDVSQLELYLERRELGVMFVFVSSFASLRLLKMTQFFLGTKVCHN